MLGRTLGTIGDVGPASDGEQQPSLIDRRRAQARRRPSEAYLRRRHDLELAAAAVMRRKGYHAMTLRDIADEVGTDRASVYYYIAGKEELLADLVLAALLENAAEFAAIAQSTATAGAKVRACMAVLMRQFDRHFPYLYVWIHQDFATLDGIDRSKLERLVELSQQEFEFIEELVGEAIGSGEFSTTLPVGVVTQSIVGLVAWTHRWYEPGRGLPPQHLADGLADIALVGLIRRTDH